MRDPFDQFSETGSGGVLTFMTGIGGFLQEFVYGYSGLRWNADAVALDPSLDGRIGGIVLRGLSWQGRHFTVSIGQKTTSITLTGGATMPVTLPSGHYDVEVGHPLSVPTRRPDLDPTGDAVRCQSANASSAQPAAPAAAAVDGSPATSWQPASVPATLTVALSHGPRLVGTMTLAWGRPAGGPSASSGPATTLRASGYVVAVSLDGRQWHTVATVKRRRSGSMDVLHFAPARARYVSVRIRSSAGGQAPMLEELTAG